MILEIDLGFPYPYDSICSVYTCIGLVAYVIINKM